MPNADENNNKIKETIQWARMYMASLPDSRSDFESLHTILVSLKSEGTSQSNILCNVNVAYDNFCIEFQRKIERYLIKLDKLSAKSSIDNTVLEHDKFEASIAPKINELKGLIDKVKLVFDKVNDLHKKNKIPNVNKDEIETLVKEIRKEVEQLEDNLLSHGQKIACALIMLVTGIGFFVSSFLLAMALVPVSSIVAPAIVEVAVGTGGFVLGSCVGKLLFKKGLFRCDEVKGELRYFNKDVTNYLKVASRAPSPATL